MKQIFVLNDIALATSKTLAQLAQGELGSFGLDVDAAWKGIDKTSLAPTVQFAVGSGNASPLMTMAIPAKVKNASLVKSTYVAEVLPTLTVVASVTSYTVNAYDAIELVVDYERDFNQNIRNRERFVVVGQGTLANIHDALAAAVNAKSENFTAVSNGATNVILTAKNSGIIKASTSFSRYSGASATTAPTFTLTVADGTRGVGTKAIVTEIVDKLYQRFGLGETVNRYEKLSLIQPVKGTKYTLLTFTFTQDIPEGATVDTDWTENEITFACDVTAGSPSTLVADLEDFIKTKFAIA